MKTSFNRFRMWFIRSVHFVIVLMLANLYYWQFSLWFFTLFTRILWMSCRSYHTSSPSLCMGKEKLWITNVIFDKLPEVFLRSSMSLTVSFVTQWCFKDICVWVIMSITQLQIVWLGDICRTYRDSLITMAHTRHLQTR